MFCEKCSDVGIKDFCDHEYATDDGEDLKQKLEDASTFFVVMNRALIQVSAF